MLFQIQISPPHADGHLRLTWGTTRMQSLTNLFNVTFGKETFDLKYTFFTPYFLQRETVLLYFTYDATSEEYNLINADVHYPASDKIGTARISYASLINVNGTINATTPIPHLSYVGCDFIVLTTL